MATAVTVTGTNSSEIDGLLSGAKWSGTVTYSFPDGLVDYRTPYYGNGAPTLSGFAQAPSQIRAAINYAVGLTLSYTNANIQYAGTNGADIMVAQSPAANPTSYAYYPSNVSAGGDIWFGTAYNYSLASLGNYYFMTALHELGHAVGLKHSHETGGVANVAVPFPHDDSEYTVMSYRSSVGGPLTGTTNEAYGYPQTYMANDILALQTLYGANYDNHNENTVYSWSPTTGQTFINGVAQLAPGGGSGGSANRIFETVWDGGGIDTYDLSNYTTNLTINLNPGASSEFSSTQLAYLGIGHYAAGNIYNAYLYNNDPRSYIDSVIGGAGDDTFIGNEIANVLNGGAGNETITGGGGNDTIIGGSGTDTVVYSGNQANYAISYDTSYQAFTISDRGTGSIDGTDTVTGVETFQFADSTINSQVFQTFFQPLPVAANDSGFNATQNTPLTIAASALLANDTDPNDDALTLTGASGGVNGTASFNAQNNTVTFTPTTGYAGPASFNYTISNSRGGTASASVGLTVNPASSSTVSLFSSSDTPAVLSNPDPSQVNLGVRFTSSATGTITGIKYYKSANDTGTHTGSLWSSNGTLLASATFTNGTTSGWQTVTFSNPVSITTGTTYVASFHSNGDYATTANYFNTAHANGPLTALAGNNGVYTYGNNNLFPTSTFNATNYWVDVMFSASGGGANQPPVAANDSGFNATQNTPLSIAASTLLANDTDPNGDALTITGASGGVNGTASFNAQTNTVTFTPTTGYTGPASFNYAVSDGQGGAASASVSLTVNPSSSSTVSLFSSNPTPSMISVNDPQSVEVGFKFQSSSAGDITGLRFYKGASNTGTHVANLWSSTGTLLATANFTNETASGWQQANFATPVTVSAGTTYIASYHSAGNYSADPNLFANAVTNGPLTAPSSVSSGGNGVYAYGTGNLFPTNSYNSTSYGVDVLFRAQLAA